MYDLHNHLLPAIDDGAPDIDTAIILAKMAVEDGITHMVCTPHIHFGRYENSKESIQNALTVFQQALVDQEISLQVAAAAEVRIGPEIMSLVQRDAIPFLGEWQGKKVMLLEFPSNAIPLGSDKLTKWLIAHDILPMIAHPERNQAIIQSSAKLKPFLDQGCLLQLTAGSLTGNFGSQVRQTAQQLLLEDKITLLASDAHNEAYRPPLISGGLAEAVALIGAQRAELLVKHNPQAISANQFVAL